MPDPGMSGMCWASHASRSVWRGSCSTPRARPSRPSGAAERGEGGAELFGDVVDDAVVGGGGAAEHRDEARSEARHEPADPPVVGAEVVAPVGDAVHLVDHDEPGLAAEHRHDGGGELRVGQPLGRHEHEVDVVGLQPLGQFGDGGVGRRVDRHAPQPEPAGGEDLVAHQRQQRGDEQRRPEPLLAQDAGGDEVHGALAPPGPLHDEHPLAPDAQRLDRLPLPVAELGGRIARQRPQRVEQRVARRLLGSLGSFRRMVAVSAMVSSMAEGCDGRCPDPAFSAKANMRAVRAHVVHAFEEAVDRIASAESVGASSGGRRTRW